MQPADYSNRAKNPGLSGHTRACTRHWRKCSAALAVATGLAMLVNVTAVMARPYLHHNARPELAQNEGSAAPTDTPEQQAQKPFQAARQAARQPVIHASATSIDSTSGSHKAAPEATATPQRQQPAAPASDTREQDSRSSARQAPPSASPTQTPTPATSPTPAPSEPAAASATRQQPYKVPSPADIINNTAGASTATLQGITFTRHHEKPALLINISRQVHYQLQEASGQISLRLKNTRARPNLTNYDNSYIRLVNVNGNSRQTFVTIVLKPDVKLDSIGYQPQPPQPLRLTFTRPGSQNDNLDLDISKVARPRTQEQQDQQQYLNALSRAHKGHYRDAVEPLKKLSKRKNPYVPAVEALSIIYLKQNRIEQARQLLERATNLYPDNIPLKRYYARMLIKKKEKAAALDYLMQASPPFPEHPHYYGLIGFLNLEQHHPRRAQVYYSRLAELEPHNVQWLLGMAAALKMQGAHNAADAIYQRILEKRDISPNVEIFIRSQMDPQF